jgi:hypothetical protein
VLFVENATPETLQFLASFEEVDFLLANARCSDFLTSRYLPLHTISC